MNLHPRLITSRPAWRRAAPALLLCAAMATSLAAQAQTGTFRNTSPKPAAGAPRAQIPQQGVNITNWGIVERQGSKTHGKIGETLFVEGRELDPNALRVELRVGNRSAQLSRKAGGSSARVEFTIPDAAMSGELTGTLQAIGAGSTVLSDDFGVCQRAAIHTVFPSPLAYDSSERDGNGEFLLTGRIMTIEGECLQELRFQSTRGKNAFSVGSSGTVILARVRSTSHAKAEIELERYVPVGRALRSEGPMRLQVPASGPTLIVDDAFVINAATPSAAPPPAKLEPITIRAVDSLTRFTPSGPLLPYAILTPEQGSFVMNGRIKVSGDNLSANRGTTWTIGSISIREAPFPDNLALPLNAVTGTVCATRSDGVRSCAPRPTTVISAPKITSVPAGWPKYGTPDESQRLSVRVRQMHTIRGFDLKPPEGLGLEAEVSVGNFTDPVAQRCKLDFRVQRFDANTISFSFGEPGGSRPADCSEQDEASLGFMRGTSPAELFLTWRHASGGEQRLRWKLVGAP